MQLKNVFLFGVFVAAGAAFGQWDHCALRIMDNTRFRVQHHFTDPQGDDDSLVLNCTLTGQFELKVISPWVSAHETEQVQVQPNVKLECYGRPGEFPLSATSDEDRKIVDCLARTWRDSSCQVRVPICGVMPELVIKIAHETGAKVFDQGRVPDEGWMLHVSLTKRLWHEKTRSYTTFSKPLKKMTLPLVWEGTP